MEEWVAGCWILDTGYWISKLNLERFKNF